MSATNKFRVFVDERQILNPYFHQATGSSFLSDATANRIFDASGMVTKSEATKAYFISELHHISMIAVTGPMSSFYELLSSRENARLKSTLDSLEDQLESPKKRYPPPPMPSQIWLTALRNWLVEQQKLQTVGPKRKGNERVAQDLLHAYKRASATPPTMTSTKPAHRLLLSYFSEVRTAFSTVQFEDKQGTPQHEIKQVIERDCFTPSGEEWFRHQIRKFLKWQS